MVRPEIDTAHTRGSDCTRTDPLTKAQLRAVARRPSGATFGLDAVQARRLPGHDGGSRCENVLYILEFDSGLIKVGRSASPRKRVETHVSHVNSYTGASLVRGWLSPFHANYDRTERDLIGAGHRTAERVQGSEFLFGADFSALVSFARKLHYLPAVQGPRARNGLDDFWEPVAAATREAERQVKQRKERPADQIFSPPEVAVLPGVLEESCVEDMLPVIRQIADSKGMSLMEACLLSWMDLYEMINQSRIEIYEHRMRRYIAELKCLAITDKRMDLAAPLIAWEDLPDEVFETRLYAVPEPAPSVALRGGDAA